MNLTVSVFSLEQLKKKEGYPENPEATRSLSLQRMTQDTTPMMVIKVMMMKEEDAMNNVNRMSSDGRFDSTFMPLGTTIFLLLAYIQFF